MNKLLRNGFAVVLAITSTLAFAQYNDSPTLKIGDPAPAIKVQTWLRGQPVTQFEKGKVYVLDFWATWCGGCIMSFPHISGIAEKYKDRVSFSSIDTKEDIEGKVDALAKVKEFLPSAWGQQLKLNVAVDGDSGAMWDGWIKPLRRVGLPTTFVIDQEGRIAWVDVNLDHLEWVLDQVLAKNWDIQKAAAVMQQRDAVEDLMFKVFRSEDAAGKKKGYEAMLASAEAFEKQFPDRKDAVAFYKFMALRELDKDRVPEVLEQMAADPRSKYINLSDAAYLTLREENLTKRTYAAAAKVLEHCLQNEYPAYNTCGKTIMDYSSLASAYSKAGDPKRAAEYIDYATVLASQQKALEQLQKLQESLKKYKDTSGSSK